MTIFALEEKHVIRTERYDASLHKSLITKQMIERGHQKFQYSVLSSTQPGLTLFLTRVFVRNRTRANVVYPDWKDGGDARFTIRANPAIHRTMVALSKRRHHTQAILRERDQIDWLREKLEGYELNLLKAKRFHHHPTPCKVGLFTINEAWFDVFVKVKSEYGMTALLSEGFGKHKNYGFGMIMPENTYLFQFVRNIIKQPVH